MFNEKSLEQEIINKWGSAGVHIEVFRRMKNQSRNEKIKLLEDYSKFLEEEGYTDVDWRAEEPTAIDKFLNRK